MDGLDFEAVPTGAAVAAETSSGAMILAAWLLVALVAAAVGGAAFSGRGAVGRRLVSVRTLPVPIKLVATALLAVYGLTHILGAASAWVQTNDVYASSSEYFFYLKTPRLLSLSHAHLMGLGTMEGLVALAYAGSRADGPWPRGIITLAFLGIVGDVSSWWLMKFAGDAFDVLADVSGAGFAVAFSWMAVRLAWDLWFSAPEAA